MKNIHRIALSTLVLAGLAAVPLTMARASVSTAGSKVLAVTVFAPNSLGNVWARVDLDLQRSGQPACANASRQSFVFRVSNDAGKAWLSELITAKASGLPVWINGTGACPAQEGSPIQPVGLNAYEEITTVQLSAQ